MISVYMLGLYVMIMYYVIFLDISLVHYNTASYSSEVATVPSSGR